MELESRKRCSHCKIEKSYSEFSKNRKRKDGRCQECKDCTSLRFKKERKEHPERNKERCKRSYRKNIEKRTLSVAHWKQKNPEKVKAINKRYYEKNKEYKLFIAQCRYTENRERILESDSAIRGRLRQKYKIPNELISEDMIERERAIIKIKRTIREIRKNGNSKADRRGIVATEPNGGLEHLCSLLS